MTPERLISVSWFPTLLVADEESRKLQDAGLQPYVASDSERLDEGAEILVPESQLDAARAVLKIESEAVPESSPIEASEPPGAIAVCPDCGSADSYRLPPYALYVLMGSVGLMAVTAILGKAWVGGMGLLVAWIVALWLSRRGGSYRCRQCGREWKPD